MAFNESSWPISRCRPDLDEVQVEVRRKGTSREGDADGRWNDGSVEVKENDLMSTMKTAFI